MYFSLLVPKPGREREAAHQRLADDAYGDHQWLWRLFPALPGTPRDFLFHRQEVAGLPRYHLVSQREPRAPGDAWHLQVRSYAPALQAGERLAFELRAAPTVRPGQRDPDGKARRHDVVMMAKRRLLAERGLSRWQDWNDAERPELYELVQQTCTAWLADRAKAAGFVLDARQCLVSSYEQHGRRPDDAGKPGLQFSSVDFSGELTVLDPDRFQHALFHGLGSAKAFGCGLLLVRQPLLVTLPVVSDTELDTALIDLAAQLYDSGKISLERAARIAGLSYSQAIDEFGRRGVATIRLTASELEADLAAFKS